MIRSVYWVDMHINFEFVYFIVKPSTNSSAIMIWVKRLFHFWVFIAVSFVPAVSLHSFHPHQFSSNLAMKLFLHASSWLVFRMLSNNAAKYGRYYTLAFLPSRHSTLFRKLSFYITHKVISITSYQFLSRIEKASSFATYFVWQQIQVYIVQQEWLYRFLHTIEMRNMEKWP